MVLVEVLVLAQVAQVLVEAVEAVFHLILAVVQAQTDNQVLVVVRCFMAVVLEAVLVAEAEAGVVVCGMETTLL